MINNFTQLSQDLGIDELEEKKAIYVDIMHNIFKGTLKSLSQQAEIDGLQLEEYDLIKDVSSLLPDCTVYSMFFANQNNTNCEVLMVFPIGILHFNTDTKKINTLVNTMVLTSPKQLEQFFGKYKNSEGYDRIPINTQEKLTTLLTAVENQLDKSDFVNLQNIQYKIAPVLECNSAEANLLVVESITDFINL